MAVTSVGKDFAEHKTVAHTLGEYVRGDVHTQDVESFFAILKRGVAGSFHSVSEQHLQRYVDELPSVGIPALRFASRIQNVRAAWLRVRLESG